MKSIVIIIGGMADTPEFCEGGRTPMMEADIPAIRELARQGETGTYFPVKDSVLSPQHALFQLFGYDPGKTLPSDTELADIALDPFFPQPDTTRKLFVLPGLSGHGAMVSPSLTARALGKLAFLEASEFYTPGSTMEEALDIVASETIRKSKELDFVTVYVDYPVKASLDGDFEEKKYLLETIDSLLITPVADYVWHHMDYVRLVVSAGFTVSSSLRRYIQAPVPFLVYHNTDELDNKISFDEVHAGKGSLESNNSPQFILRDIMESYL